MIQKILPLIALFICTVKASSQTVGLLQHSDQSLDDGYILFAPIGSKDTYLIDKCGKLAKTWSSDYFPGVSCYLLPDGTLLRTGNVNNTNFVAGGQGGIIEKFDWDGQLIWHYEISDKEQCQHHDIKALPNGNILIITWEIKSKEEAIIKGGNPSKTPTLIWSEKIVEIEPFGTDEANIVWEWHAWDHLVQDFDSRKDNFGSISSSPQLINLNYGMKIAQSDWLHFNSVDYNAALDQILISVHNMNEIWIIDHSTSTEEAALHSGGNSGKGGDILYRWGNAAVYDNGTADDQHFFGQHNAHWIEEGFPHSRQIMIFNNGLNRTGGNYSTVEIIEPPDSGYLYSARVPYLPGSYSWIYNNGNPYNYYAQNVSGAQQLSNGNVLMCNGPSGTFTEIDSLENVVWKYINPVSTNGIVQQNEAPSQNIVFRCTFYPKSFQGFSNRTLTTEKTIENSNPVSETCNQIIPMGLNEYQLAKSIKVSPNPASKLIKVDCKGGYQLFSNTGQLVKQSENDTHEIDIKELPEGLYILKYGNKVSRFIKSN